MRNGPQPADDAHIGKPMVKIGNQEITKVPTNIATTAGATEATTSRKGFLNTALAK